MKIRGISADGINIFFYVQTLAFMFKFRFSPRLYLSSLSEDDRTAVVPSALLSTTDSTLQKRHHFFIRMTRGSVHVFFTGEH